MSTRAMSRARAVRLVALVIALGMLLRVVLSLALGLGVDESYAVAVARSFALSYFDHPPLSFWLAGAAAKLAGSERAIVVRLPFIIMFGGSTWLTYWLGARLFGERAGAYGAVALNLSPVFSISTGGWLLPDGPLTLSELAAVACLARILLYRTPAHSTRWWLGAGVFTGLALLSKYQGVLLLAGAVLFLVSVPEQRRWLRQPGPYVMCLVALALFLPVLIWNARHQWLSFRFQAGRGAPLPGLHPLSLLQSLGGQALYVLPWIWLSLVWLLGAGLARGSRDPNHWFFCCLAIGPIAWFALAALGGRPGLPHWPAPGYLVLFPLLGAALDAQRSQRRGIVWAWFAGSTTAFVILVVALAAQAATGWMTRAAPSLFARGDPFLEALDWRALGPALATRGLPEPPGRGFVAATSWFDAGKIAYALGPSVPVVCLCRHPHEFQFLHPQRDVVGEDAVLITRGPADSSAAAAYRTNFRAVEPVGTVMIRRAGRPAVALGVYLGRVFTSPVPIDSP